MDYKDQLESQIREEYGKLVYSYTCHWVDANRLTAFEKRFRLAEIIITALTATEFMHYLCTDNKVIAIVAALFSALSLGLTLFSYQSNAGEQIVNHRQTADALWLVREEYISLLTDIDVLEEKDIANKRDSLIKKSSNIYKAAIPTSTKAYSIAQKKIKDEEYQFFTREEIDVMLPEHLRSKRPK